MIEDYLVLKESTGLTETLKISYEEAINAGVLRTITRDGESYRIIDKVGQGFGRTRARRRDKQVTRRDSIAAGVHRDQVGEARDLAKKLNAGIEVNNDGTVSFGSRRARRDWLRSQKLRDNEGGYGD